MYIRDRMDDILTVFTESFGKEILCQREVVLQNSRNDPDAPITCPKRYPLYQEQDADYRVVLDYQAVEIGQFYFQAAHEFSHVMMRCYPDDKGLQWVSECLCETASLFVLKRLRSQLRNQFTPLHQRFIRATKEARMLMANETLKSFYEKYKSELAGNAIGPVQNGYRTRNAAVGLWFMWLLEVNPPGWKSIVYLCDAPLPTAEYESAEQASKVLFGTWRDRCEAGREKRFVTDISSALGLELNP